MWWFGQILNELAHKLTSWLELLNEPSRARLSARYLNEPARYPPLVLGEVPGQGNGGRRRCSVLLFVALFLRSFTLLSATGCSMSPSRPTGLLGGPVHDTPPATTVRWLIERPQSTSLRSYLCRRRASRAAQSPWRRRGCCPPGAAPLAVVASRLSWERSCTATHAACGAAASFEGRFPLPSRRCVWRRGVPTAALAAAPWPKARGWTVFHLPVHPLGT
jgi:hypothetical protein